MALATFSFIVNYKDGRQSNILTPYRGNSTDDNSLEKFAADFYAGPPGGYINIAVRLEREFDDEREFITAIKDMESFKGLFKIIGFCGDLLTKYYPEDLEKLMEDLRNR